MNENYAVNIVDISQNGLYPDSGREYLGANQLAAANRLMLLFDVIDFDQIKTVCDVGSRFLEQTLEMANIFTEANLYAFEPVPDSYKICCDNRLLLDETDQKRVAVYNLAVGSETKTIPFYAVDNTGSEFNVGASSKYRFVPGLNGSFFGKTWNQTEIQVQQVRLDDWRRENNIAAIDLLWMDVQGAELDALKGAEETLRDVKVIMTEVGLGTYYQGQSLKPEIDAYLDSQGFRELASGFQQNHQYEGDTIYIRK